MIVVSKYESLLDKKIKAICNDGQVVIGKWIDWTSAVDNEPDPESITIETNTGLVEIYVHEIAKIEEA